MILKLSILCFLLSLFLANHSYCQKVVFDQQHLAAVNQNAAARLAAEHTQQGLLNAVKESLDDISLNLGAIVLVQTMIRNSKLQVSALLRQGRAVKGITEIAEQILSCNQQLLSLAASRPHLLLFAQNQAAEMESRARGLFVQVSDFVIKEHPELLMNYQKRDFLLAKITLELKVMRALSFSMLSAVYWAKVNGLLSSANPYRSFFGANKALVQQILWGTNLLIR